MNRPLALAVDGPFWCAVLYAKNNQGCCAYGEKTGPAARAPHQADEGPVAAKLAPKTRRLMR